MLLIMRKMSLITNPIAPIIKNPIEHCLAILTNSKNIMNILIKMSYLLYQVFHSFL